MLLTYIYHSNISPGLKTHAYPESSLHPAETWAYHLPFLPW